MGSFRDWRAYRKLPAAWREIVFYSESGQDWHHFEPLIAELVGPLERRVTYVTSDATDPGLGFTHQRFRSLCIREGWFLTIHFQFQRAGVVVLTMMDLGNLQLKRSINPVHYIYVFHSLGSTHMVDHAESYDAYDTLLCAGPHHVRELRKREELMGMAPRNLFEYGYPRLDDLRREAARFPASGDGQPVVLVAPTWGADSIFDRCGDELVGTLLNAGFRVIARPHYHTRRLTPSVLDALYDKYRSHERFEREERMGEKETLFRSDLLISDWSAMAIEYAFALEKPVLFIDLPRRIRNPNWQALEIDPFESSIRDEVGEILSPDQLDRAPQVAHRLLAARAALHTRISKLRDVSVFNQGQCVPLGAREIARLADEHRGGNGG